MKAPYDDLNFVRELSKYKWCRANLAVIKRFLLPDWSVYGKISVKSRKIGKRNTLKRNTQKKKKKGYETEKNLNMESDHIMKNNDKEPDENKLVTETDFGKDAKENGNENKLYLNKDMESSVSLIGLEIIWVFKGGGIET